MSAASHSLAGLSLEEKRRLAAELLAERRAGRAVEHPLSYGQRAWWFLHRLEPENPAHNVVFAARVPAGLDLDAFRSAFQQLVDRHPILRTTYHAAEDEPFQRIHPVAESPVEVVELSAQDSSTLAESLSREACRPFDLDSGPVFRVTVFRCPKTGDAFVLSFHHVAADLWSVAIVLRELDTLYPAIRRGGRPSLPRPRSDYTDFVDWERSVVHGEAGERLWRYWQERLDGDPVRLDLPADRPRRETSDGRGAVHRQALDRDATARLGRLAADRGCTRFVLLLALYKLLLHRLTGQSDLHVGSLFAKGRSRADLVDVVGFLDNPVPLRTRLDGDCAFTGLLERVQRTVLEAVEHQEMPFSLLVERLCPDRRTGIAPLFQTMFILQRSRFLESAGVLALALGETDRARLGGLELELVDLERRAATALAGQLDLTLTAAELDGRTVLLFQYDPDRFDRTTVARMAGAFRSLLDGVLQAPESRLSELPILAPAEEHQVAVEWNDSAAVFAGGGACLHELFERRAADLPDMPAVLAGEGEAMTYREVDRASEALAHRLQRLGVGPEVRVGVCAEPSVDRVVALFGILKAGGAYVPLDPAYPEARLRTIAERAGLRLVVAEEGLEERLSSWGDFRVVAPTGRESAPALEPVPRTAASSHAAYAIFTSGSTGEPKGVMIDHRSVVNTVLEINRRFEIGPGDRVFAVSSLSFDLSVYDVFGTLAAGAAVVLPARSSRPDPAAWVRRMERHGVTVWNSAPPLMEMVHGDLLERNASLPTSLRLVLLSGDWIPVSLPGALRRMVPGLDVVSLGGATEASIWSIFHPVEERDAERPSVPYGRPLANQRFHVLDRNLRPVPAGVVGELFIGGEGCARGYLGRPALTAERFVPEPYGRGDRLYRTGDLGCYFPDGGIEFLGRTDFQVKIRGFRVELGEIEAHLTRHPAVRECVVLAPRDESGARQVVAYCVPAPGATLSPAELREHLRDRLPEYMVPSVVVPLERFPLTPNGKLDRGALPVPRPETGAGGVAPRSGTQAAVAAVFAEVLDVEEVGIEDDFFALGGHSLRGTQVISRLRDEIGVELPLAVLFDHPVVADLAIQVDAALRAPRIPAAPPIRPVVRKGPQPLSFAQERLWFAEQLEPGSGAYAMPGAIDMEGSLDPVALARAVDALVRRHESLRTGFEPDADGPVQVVRSAVDLPTCWVDLSLLDGADRVEEQFRRIVDHEVGRPFALDTPPLVRVRVIRLDPRRHRLLVVVHHLVADGWSMGIFVRDLVRFYEAETGGPPAGLPELTVQYVDYARWQREWLRGKVLESLLDHWRQRLADAPPTIDLPSDRPRPAVRSSRGGAHSRRLPEPLARGVRRLSRRHGVTLFMVLLTAFKALLHRTTGSRDLVVGTDAANRGRRETENLLGFFVNHPVLRTRVTGDPTFAELLASVRRTTLDAFAHQELPFEKLVEELRPERSLSHTPVFQVLFVVQNVPLGPLRTREIQFVPTAVETPRTKFDLVVMMRETEEGLVETWSYSSDLFDRSTIVKLSGHLEALLEAAVAVPDTRLGDLELVTRREKRQQLIQRQQRREQGLDKLRFKRKRRRAVDLSRVKAVETEALESGGTRCLVYRPTGPDVDLFEWAEAERAELERELRDRGALLFRGFTFSGVRDFERFARIFCPELFAEYGDLPRAQVGGDVYESTPYPPDQWILYHNESSHMDRWPLKQFFHCAVAAREGGDTPIADGREVYRRLDPEVQDRFERLGVRYVRNFTPEMDVSWQEFFGTEDRSTVEEACRAGGIEAEWKAEGTLRTKRLCPAVATHPVTGETVFFNQIQAHHISCLDDETRESLLSLFAPEDLPRNVYFGDGSPIEDEVMDHVIDTYHAASLRFPWERGDILMVDNMLIAHSRAPFAGERKIVVAMGEMVGHDETVDAGRGGGR